MPPINIPCPACGTSLKLPDASLIGKRGKCPKCAHRFVLALPESDEVPLELADAPVLPAAPLVGKAARWVPDDASVPQTPLPSTSASPPAAHTTLPANTNSEPPAKAAADGLPFDGPSPDIFSFPDVTASPGAIPDLNFSTPAVTPVKARENSGPRRNPNRRASRKGLVAMGVTAFVVLVASGVAYLLDNRPAETQLVRQTPAVNENWEAEKQEQANANESAQSLSPTSGKTIPLDYLPFTPHVICHLRPTELWKKNDRTIGEFQAVLGDFGIWLKDQIQKRTRFEPQDIAELTIAINFGSRMSEPEVAAVVRLREPMNKSERRARFKGQRRADPNIEIYEADDFSYLVIDDQTFSLASTALTDDLILSRKDEALSLPDMDPLLKKSDRDRHVTLLFDTKILDSHREDAFMIQLQQVADKFILWLGEDVETVSWSMHLEPNFFMETLLHNATSSSVVKVQRHAQLQLSRLAEEMLAGVKRMKPSTAGTRQMIGRFPAMLQALDLGTTTHVDQAYARLITVLPRNASVNLAAGALLTWNQSLLTNFTEKTATAADDGMQVPEKLVDRLKLKVLVDFRRTPLQEAFGYIGESIKTDVEIDGDALKGAGFTQNMPQTLELGTVTAQAAIHEILKKYAAERDPLVLIVDEGAKKLVLSTKVKAEQDGLKQFDTTPAQ